MKININILTDYLKEFGELIHNSRIINEALTFKMASLLESNLNFEKKYLYINSDLPKAQNAAKEHPKIIFLTILDEDATISISNPNNLLILKTDQTAMEIFHRVQEYSIMLQSWDTELRIATLKNKSVQFIFDLSEKILSNPVVLLDPSMHAAAHMSNVNTNDELYLACVKLGYHPEESMKIFRKFRVLEVAHEEYEKNMRPAVIDPFDSSPNNLISYAIPICNFRYYVVTMVCENRLASEGLIELYLQFINYVADSLNRSIERQPDDNYFHEYFYTDILDKQVTDETAIKKRAEQFNLPVNGNFRLIKTDLDVVNFAQATWALNELTAKLNNVKSFMYKKDVLAIIELSNDNKTAEEELQIAIEQIQIIDKDYHAFSGISNTFYKLSQLPRQYVQATEALAIGKTLYHKEKKYSTVFRYDKLYFFHMLETTQKIMDISQLCTKQIFDIIAYDKKHETDNFELLYTYLQNERKATETAKKLHMHRNNIIYRVQRMEAIFDLDLKDLETRFNLLMSFKILSYYDKEISDI